MNFQSYFPLIGRILLSLTFFYGGTKNLLNYQATRDGIAGMLPFPDLALIGNIICCLLGAISLVLGFKIRWGATLLIIFLIPTNVIFHNFLADPQETIPFLKNLGFIGAMFYIVYFGAGPASLDRKSTPDFDQDYTYARREL
ncbi:MAG: DoxX family protein [Oscillatoriales cyanobacterium RM2_1_1]|nr:DoxX family protein [Oscillatoriales cyanobacterium SM2_3_0]NJO47000.1 DoxX family protein [Oscillatoriales cyanobacterium RM2_1_1]